MLVLVKNGGQKKSMALPSSVGKQQELQEHNLKSLSTYSSLSLEVWWPVIAYELSNFVIIPKRAQRSEKNLQYRCRESQNWEKNS